MLMVSLRHGYANLINFKGRDRRILFWPFALVHFVGSSALASAVMLPQFFSRFDKVEDFAREHPDKVTVTYGPGSVSYQLDEPIPGLMPDIGAILGTLGGIGFIFIVLTAAAVARRLHDTGRSAWLGAIPAVLFCAAMLMMVPVFKMVETGGEPGLVGFLASFVLNLLYNISLIVLVVLLAMKSEPTENRYGPLPDTGSTP